ncbi:hypothetical protein Golax_001318 [Gossypium laxum]|uniref:Uncharacterized protein n=1 Tax=Gossypium laxum TaxID=34288 RepID=A0A7J9AWF9_9ROSI|nr:hypothetical protein [Gossypium laxum]
MSMALFESSITENQRGGRGGREKEAKEAMGRPPCCDKVGIKKGPWTPEEDIILVSYIQEHGPGNWRSVPTNTGLMRCSKSCRLRWTNYLRPGIKRGNFTSHEEGMIIHLQALLGNKWAAIASYLPQRTDNDIKNYWNTHLKKKLRKFQSAMEPPSMAGDEKSLDFAESETGAGSSNLKLNQTSSSYASSTENISRLLQGWMRSSPKINNNNNSDSIGSCSAAANCDLISHGDDQLESILSFENMKDVALMEKSTSKATFQDSGEKIINPERKQKADNNNNNIDDNNNNNSNPPLSFLEKWLLDESSSAAQVEEIDQMMELPSIF